MNTYLSSNYLNVIDCDDCSLLFNGINGAIDKVSLSLGKYLSNKSARINDSNFDNDMITYLYKRGYITKYEEGKEIELFQKYVELIDEKKKKRQLNAGHLMLLLSYNCNLNCPYCYQYKIREQKIEEKKRIISTKLIRDILIKRFDMLYPNVDHNKLSICLYGGEPLLKPNLPVIKEILRIAKSRDITEISVITNGTCVEPFINYFGSTPGKINRAQITLDGFEDEHNNSRIPISRSPTFQSIIKNIHSLLEKNVYINLRINITSRNIQSINKLEKFLKINDILEHPNMSPYVFPVHIHLDCNNEDGLLSRVEVSQYMEQTNIDKNIDSPIKRKAKELSRLFKKNNSKPILSNTNFCMMNSNNNYIIDAEGHIYKCYEEAGRKEYKVGTIQDKLEFNHLNDYYISRHIGKVEKCSKCSLGLVCGGECGVVAKLKNGSYYEPYCGDTKEIIKKAIAYLYKNKHLYLNTKQNFD